MNKDIIERKRIEDELRIREAYLSAILENQPGLVWLKDTKSRFLLVNNVFAVSCGKQTPEDITGKTDFEIWPYELAEKYRADDAQVMLTDKSISVEELIQDKGEAKWFETFKTPVKDIDGIIIGTTGYARDITGRKKLERIKEINIQIQKTLNKILQVSTESISFDESIKKILLLALSSKYLRLQPKGGIFLTEKEGEMLHLQCSYNLPEVLQKICAKVPFGHCLCGRAASTGELQFTHCLDERHDNRYNGIAAHGHYNIPIHSDGKVLGVVVVYLEEGHQKNEMEVDFLISVADILSGLIIRNQAEEAIKENEKKFRVLYNETPVMMHSINLEGKLLSVSDFWTEKLGYQREEVLNRNFTEFLTESSRKHALEIILPQFKLTGHIENVDYCFVKKNGEAMNCLLSAITQRDDTNNFIRSLAVITDITERKKDLEKLVKAESQIRNFATHINHVLEDERAGIAREIHDELGQQLAGIKIGLSTFKKINIADDKMQEKVIDMMQDVDTTIQSLRKIATQLRPGILDSLGLIPSLQWLGSEFEKKTKIKCKLEMDVKEQKFEKNLSTCFFRICQEALTNISKHAAASEVIIHVSRNGDELVLKISDNGKGISSEKLENPFSMGLLGMRERANIIGADLQIVSKKDSGTTVQLKKQLN